MNVKIVIVMTLAATILCGGKHIGENTNGCLFAQDWPPPLPGQEQPEVLTRGPVHEAFAEPVTFQVEEGLIVSNRPPANIEEVPPAYRPQGEDVVWVPGYWSWDADRNDFIWVSACWRVAPPNMYWMPGYWAEVTDVHRVNRGGVDVNVGGLDLHFGGRTRDVETARWEWVSGFWASAESQEIEYLPAPPAPEDIEPPGLPPAADNMWVPGCWYWHEDQYMRRSGYWLRQQPDWVWVPSHYRWTPRGYVFEAGHWDYALERRGVLFAPVYFSRSVYTRRGFSYSPSIVIDMDMLSANLFTYPRYGHYYFGDYYDDAYLRIGIYPQFESERRHTWYDPIYTHDRWRHSRTDQHWADNLRQEYDHRRSDKSLRPARTYREMETRVVRMPEAQRRNVELARPIEKIVERKASPLRFEQINTDARHKIAKQGSDVHKLRDERVKWEATGARDAGTARQPAGATTTRPPAERRDRVTPPAEQRDRVTPPAEQKERATPPAERRDRVTPPAEQRDRVTQPVEQKERATPPAERRDRVTRPAEDTPVVVPPREVQRTRPERVKIPVPPPVVGKRGTPGNAEQAPPPKPIEEHKVRGADKDKDADKAKDADRDKDADKDKAKDKDSHRKGRGR